MRTLVMIAGLAGIALWNIRLQRRLHAANTRGEMYRAVAARLERRLTGLNGQEH